MVGIEWQVIEIDTSSTSLLYNNGIRKKDTLGTTYTYNLSSPDNVFGSIFNVKVEIATLNKDTVSLRVYGALSLGMAHQKLPYNIIGIVIKFTLRKHQK